MLFLDLQDHAAHLDLHAWLHLNPLAGSQLHQRPKFRSIVLQHYLVVRIVDKAVLSADGHILQSDISLMTASNRMFGVFGGKLDLEHNIVLGGGLGVRETLQDDVGIFGILAIIQNVVDFTIDVEGCGKLILAQLAVEIVIIQVVDYWS